MAHRFETTWPEIFFAFRDSSPLVVKSPRENKCRKQTWWQFLGIERGNFSLLINSLYLQRNKFICSGEFSLQQKIAHRFETTWPEVFFAFRDSSPLVVKSPRETKCRKQTWWQFWGLKGATVLYSPPPPSWLTLCICREKNASVPGNFRSNKK